MIQLDILDESKQKFSVILNNQRVTIQLWYSVLKDRWSFDLALDGEWVINGRRIVMGVDLLAPFQLGIGVMFCAPETPGAVPDRTALPLGLVRLYHATQGEVDAAVSA